MVLQGKARQDIKAIDLRPVPQTFPQLGTQRMGLGLLSQHSLLTHSLASFPQVLLLVGTLRRPALKGVLVPISDSCLG